MFAMINVCLIPRLCRVRLTGRAGIGILYNDLRWFDSGITTYRINLTLAVF